MGGTSGCSKVTELRERDDRSGLTQLFEMQRTIQVIHIFVGFVAVVLYITKKKSVFVFTGGPLFFAYLFSRRQGKAEEIKHV